MGTRIDMALILDLCVYSHLAIDMCYTITEAFYIHRHIGCFPLLESLSLIACMRTRIYSR